MFVVALGPYWDVEGPKLFELGLSYVETGRAPKSGGWRRLVC